MSKTAATQYECATCGVPIAGQLVSEADKGDYAVGYQCAKCKAFLCVPARRHMKVRALQKWKEAICPECGEQFEPGKTIVDKGGQARISSVVNTLQMEESKAKGNNLFWFIWRLVPGFYAGPDKRCAVLRRDGALVELAVLSRADWAGRDVTSEAASHFRSQMHGMVRVLLKWQKDCSLQFADEAGAIYRLRSSPKYEQLPDFRHHALGAILDIEASTHSGQAIQLLSDALLNDPTAYIRAMLARELGRIAADYPEVINALREARQDAGTVGIETPLSLAGLFMKDKESVGEIAARTLAGLSPK